MLSRMKVRSAAGALEWRKSMVYGFGTLLSEETYLKGTTFIQGDYVGSPNLITDATGKVVGRTKNLPFGERFGSKFTDTAYKSSRRYTNHEDQDGSAIYMQARTYLPTYGRFAQVDPAYDQTKDDPESWNLYNYVTNNPVTHTDPDGREVMNYSPALSKSQQAMFESTGLVMDGLGHVWSGQDFNDTQAYFADSATTANTSTQTLQGGQGASGSASGGAGSSAGIGGNGTTKETEAPSVQFGESEGQAQQGGGSFTALALMSAAFGLTPPKPSISFDALWSNHPVITGNTPVLDPKKYENQCAIALSAALLKSGLSLKGFSGALSWDPGTKYALRAQELANWLASGKSGLKLSVTEFTGKDAFNKINGKRGIIFIKNYYGPGNQGDHIDLWNGSRMTRWSSYFRVHWSFGQSNLFSAQSVLLMEMK